MLVQTALPRIVSVLYEETMIAATDHLQIQHPNYLVVWKLQ